MKNDTAKLQKGAQRKEAIEQGFFDGRFAPKVVPNKKAILKRKQARKKIDVSDY
jgi:hypothetical protein